MRLSGPGTQRVLRTKQADHVALVELSNWRCHSHNMRSSLWWAALGAALRTDAFESCAEARRYYKADALMREARRLRAGRANVSRPLRFLHVPKNAGTTIQRLLPDTRPRTTVLDGRTCGKCIKVGGPCACLLYTSPSPRDRQKSRMPSSA